VTRVRQQKLILSPQWPPVW